MKGQIIGGSFDKLLVRQKSGEHFEIGELVVAENQEVKVLLQVTDIHFGSQVSQQNLELISGMRLEEQADFSFMDASLRLYSIATLKSILNLSKESRSKILPSMFSNVREVKEEDLKILTQPKNPLYVGNLRSGSRMLDVPIFLNGRDVLSHHILVPATTGKGKSNLTSVILWDVTPKDYAGMLVLDPHDEYFKKLQDHPSKDKVVYYTPGAAPVGGRSLKINIRKVKPEHFNGVSEWSSAQREALLLAYKAWGESWILRIMQENEIKHIQDATFAVVKRRVANLLNLSCNEGVVSSNGIFDVQAGEHTIRDITKELEDAKTVIINTSSCPGKVEILIGALIATEVFNHYKYLKIQGGLSQKPVISIILEEAPRVLGKEVLEKGSNIFSTIAREGRKFQVGLFAITQLPSLIPRSVLANMNTKIILGVEMAPERVAIIESASQDLSEDNRNIASLDRGEAILTSNFTPFAVPIMIPLFSKNSSAKKEPPSFSGVNLN